MTKTRTLLLAGTMLSALAPGVSPVVARSLESPTVLAQQDATPNNKDQRREQRQQQRQDQRQQQRQEQRSQQQPAKPQPPKQQQTEQQRTPNQPHEQRPQQQSQEQQQPQRRPQPNQPQTPPSQAQQATPQRQAPQPQQSERRREQPTAQQANGRDNPRRIEDLRKERKETKEGNRTIIREGDRTIVRQDNRTIIRHDEVNRFRLGSRDVKVERQGADTRTIINRPNGEQIVNVVDGNGRLLRRIRRDKAGHEVVIIDNRPRAGQAANVVLNIRPPTIRIPRDRYIVEVASAPPALLYETLEAPPVDQVERAYTLDEIRDNPNLRARMRRVDLDTITFDTGSWDVAPAETERLAPIGNAMRQAITKNNAEVFLVEGHTDAVGDDVDNLSLSDRRAEAVAEVLSEKFGIPPENLTTQGYGEQQLKVQTQGPERQNRRVSVRRITPLLAGGASATGNGG